MMQDQDYYSPVERLEVAQEELETARFLSHFSSTAYSKGNLQRASDAHSKVNILCARAAEQLTAPELDRRAADSITLRLNGVRDALHVLSVRFGQPRRIAG
jgi:hypothetical protein